MALLPDKGTEITETTTIAIQPNKTYKMLIININLLKIDITHLSFNFFIKIKIKKN